MPQYRNDSKKVGQNDVQLICEKQKDYPEFDPMQFVFVTLGGDDDTPVLEMVPTSTRPNTPRLGNLIITNPPWDRKILHALIEKIVDEKRAAWLLFDADWCHTKQSTQYMPYVGKIVSIGRVKWIEGSKHTGKENCAWYYIDHEITETTFYGRLVMPT